MPLDPTTSAFLVQVAASGLKPVYEMTPEQARLQYEAGSQPADPQIEMLRVAEATLVVSGGEVLLRCLVPSAAPRAVIVYYHGGGWVIGSVNSFDATGRKLAKTSDCAVVLVDYRLAPEHPFPAAVDDAYAALLWAETNLEAIAGRRVPLIVAGDSAGGNLAAVTAQRARDRDGPAIALQILIYPATSCRTDTQSCMAPENQLVLNRKALLWFLDLYLPDPASRILPDAAPLLAEDLSRLPPAVVLTAEYDIIRDEGEAYAARLIESGVPVIFRRYEGQIHGFLTRFMLPGSALAFDDIKRAIDNHLATSAASGGGVGPNRSSLNA